MLPMEAFHVEQTAIRPTSMAPRQLNALASLEAGPHGDGSKNSKIWEHHLVYDRVHSVFTEWKAFGSPSLSKS